MTEEKGITLWNPNHDISLADLPKRKCGCGAPAVAAVRRIEDPGDLRVFLCAAHLPGGAGVRRG